MNLVSVIIPYYKKKEFILKSINSVLKQSYKNFEIIIIYDDREKEDLDLIKKIVSIDKRIKLIINKKSLGAGLSRNRGIKKAKGDFISFIDSDDLWEKKN
jgi:teichuronic acid biosynthesis glycosyltransferase TuaG